MPGMIGADELIAPGELAAVLGWTDIDVKSLLGDSPDVDGDGLMSMRAALRFAIFARLGMSYVLTVKQAAVISADAAMGAKLDENQILVVAWMDGQMRCAWFDGPPGIPAAGPLRSPTVTIPVGAMMLDLATGISLMRERAGATLQ